MNNLISIVMPAYNCESYVAKAIDSILNQSYKNIELLIADDYSTDGTKNIIDSYKDTRIKRYHNTNNLGYLKTTNNLLKLTIGDFICFQDADDYCATNKLELQFKHIVKNNLDACGTSFYRIDINDKIIASEETILDLETLRAISPPKAPFCTSSFMINRGVYNKIGGYNEYFDRCGAEDVYWAYEIIDSFKFNNMPEKLYFYRTINNSITRSVPNSLKKTLITPILTFLLLERRKGNNILANNNYTELNKHIEELEKPFKTDPFLFLKHQMIHYFWLEQYTNGFKIAFKIIIHAPIQEKKFYKTVYMYLSKIVKKTLMLTD